MRMRDEDEGDEDEGRGYVREKSFYLHRIIRLRIIAPMLNMHSRIRFVLLVNPSSIRCSNMAQHSVSSKAGLFEINGPKQGPYQNTWQSKRRGAGGGYSRPFSG